MAVRKRQSTRHSEHTLQEAFDSFIVAKDADGVSQDTLRNYNTTFKKFCASLSIDPERVEIKNFTINDINKWKIAMRNDEIKVASINHYLRDMRVFFYWVMEDDIYTIDKPFKITLVKGQEETPKDYSEEEIKKLIKKPTKKATFGTWRSWIVANWIMATGNREATVCNVKLEDVDFQKKEITLTHTKNKSAQVLPLSKELEKSLKEYLAQWEIDKWLFPSSNGNKLTTTALRKSFTKYCADCGVSHSNLHGLRHTFAANYLRNNGNMFKLQQILGHSTLEMTRHYVKLYGNDLKENYDKYSPLDTIKRKENKERAIKRKTPNK